MEWSSRTDLNCYTKIFVYRHRPLAVLFWLFILLASSGITFWLIAKSIIDYFNFTVVSQIGIFHETKAVFPTVTICDNHPFRSQQAQEIYEEMSQKYNISLNDSKLIDYVKLFVTTPNHSGEKKRTFGFNLSQIKSCSFSGEACDMKREINWIWSFSYGNCWQFNSGQDMRSNLKETYNGIDYGLDMTVSLEFQNKYLSTNTLSHGLIVFIHNNSVIPLKTEKSQVFIKPGEKSFLAVKRIFNYKMPYPYSKCIDLNDYSSDLYDFIKTRRKYRQTDCFRLCRQKLYIENCECNSANDFNLNFIDKNLRFCTGDDLGCIDRQYYNFSREECERNSCPLECDSIEYDLKLSGLTYPNKNTTLRLIVYYSSLEYTIIKEFPQTTELGLFANIGGTLGLFISTSIFTLFEIFEVLFLVLRVLFKKNSF